MNVREEAESEEDRQKNNCPSRGLGLAAAAIGVGVGAALYYFFSKREENPHGQGATSSGWSEESLSQQEQMAILRQEALMEQEQMSILRQENYRQRAWTLEECSICFDVILRNQPVRSLACAHRFHEACITPWLEQQQTCPNCRKPA